MGFGISKVLQTGAGLFAVAAWLTLAAACGGDDSLVVDDTEVPGFLEAALPGANELPGPGWEMTSENEFDDGSAPPADTEVCRELYDEYQATVVSRDNERVGRRERTFERDASPQVQVSIAVYDNNEANELSVETFGTIMQSDDLVACFVDAIRETGEDVEVTGELADPYRDAPEDGYAAASEYDIAGGPLDGALRIETYSWRAGNAGITVSLFGDPGEFTEELVTNLVALVAAKFDAATR
jgi:hypothetical protein